jgi:tetratricopeptide (TPR) repeat protein/transcriptional regulator with XRE-family HTH domain
VRLTGTITFGADFGDCVKGSVGSQMANETPPELGFGRLVLSLRRKAGLTQEELADRSGVSVRALSDIERGRTTRPYKDSVGRLADALRLSGPARQHFIDAARGRGSGPAPSAAPIVPAPLGAVTRLAQLVPRQMPSGVPYFVGRDSELSALATHLRPAPGASGPRVAVISGTAGVGKTALALHWAYGATERFPDGQLYVNLRGFDPSQNPVTPTEAIRGFLAAFGIPDERIPANPQALAALYRTVLIDRELLLVLDNAYDAGQVRPLLPGAPTCRVVVTSRNQLAGLAVTAGARLICLGVLTPGQARQTLALRLGDRRLEKDPKAVNTFLTLTARLPLALAIVAARCAARQDFPLGSLAVGLAEARSRLDNLDAGDPETSVRTAFSWSFQNLTEPAARMFRLLGLHPGPDVTIRAAASLAGLPREQTAKALTELTTASMLTEHVPGRYSFHDLLREYAAEQCRLTDEEADRHAAIRRMLDYYLVTAYEADQLLSPIRRPLAIASPSAGTVPEHHFGLEQAMAWLKAEHKVLLASIGRAASAGFDTHACQLAYATATFFDRQGHWDDLSATQQIAIAAAERTLDLDGQAAAHRSLADACSQLGLGDDARLNLRHALDLYRQLGDLDGQGRVELDLNRALSSQGEHGKAVEHAHEALRLFESTGHRAGQAHALNAIGYTHSQLSDYEEGLRRCLQALELFRDLGDRSGEAATWDSVGWARHHLGDHAAATACLERALELGRELGDKYSQAQFLDHLGDARRATGHFRAAAAAYHEALVILNDLNHPDADAMNIKLGQLGWRSPAG